MSTPTTHYDLLKQNKNENPGTWGEVLNDNLDKTDAGMHAAQQAADAAQSTADLKGDMFKSDYDDGEDDGTVAKSAALKPGGWTFPTSLDFQLYATVPGSVFKARDICVQNQYAYLCSHSLPGTPCVACFDVSNPKVPVYVSGIALTLDGNNATLCNAIYVRGQYAFVGRNGGRLVVVDFSDVANPVQRGTVTHGGQIFGLDAAGGFVYVANASSGFYIEDVTDKDAPYTIGSVTGFGAGGVAAYGKYAYVTDYGADSLRIYDCSDPTSPSLVSSVATGSFPVVFHVESGYAFVCEYGGDRIEIFNCTDIFNPVKESEFNTAFSMGSYGRPRVVGDYLYLSCGSGANATIEVWNVFDKANPTLALSLTGMGGGVNAIAHPFVDGSALFVPSYVTPDVSGGLATVCNFVWYFHNLRLGDITVGRINAVDRSVFRDLDVRGSANLGGNLAVENVFTAGELRGAVGVATVTAASYNAREKNVILCDCSAQPVQVTLPAVANSKGQWYEVKKVDATANAVTIVGTVDGGVNPTLNAQYDHTKVVCDGSAWFVVG